MMPQTVDNLAELIAVLTKAIQTNPQGLEFIALDGGLFPEAGQLAGYLGSSPLTITQIEGKALLTPGATSVTLHGTSPLFGKAEYEVTLTGTVPQTTPLLKMTGAPSGTWAFGTEFPKLPDYQGFADGRLARRPSFFEKIAIGKPVFTVSTYNDPPSKLTEGLSLAGTLDATKGDLASVGKLLPGGSSLPLSGSIEVRKAPAFPLIDMTAQVPGLTLPKFGTGTIQLATSDDSGGREGSDGGSSIIQMVGTVAVTGLNPITISAPLLQGGSIWAFLIDFGDGLTLSQGLSQLSGFVDGYPLALPSGLDVLDWLALQEMVVGLRLPESAGEPPELTSVGVTVGTKSKWALPIPGIAIGDLAAQWIIVNPSSSPLLNGQVTGTIFMGSGDDAPRLNVTVDLPAVNSETPPPVEISAALDTRYPVRLGQVFKTFTNGAIDLDLNVSQLSLLAVPGQRSLFIYCVLDGKWPLPLPAAIEFNQLNFYIEYSPNSLSGSVTVAMTIAKCDFAITAAHRGPNQGWQFHGGLLPGQSIQVVEFFKNLLPEGWPGLPESLSGLEITRFAFSYDTLTSDYSFKTALEWKFELADRNWEVAAAFDLAAKHKNQETQYEGEVAGSIAINAFKITVAYEFAVKNSSTLTFRIQYESLSLTCTLTKNKEEQSILTARLGGVTFGGILEYLVNLVDPSLGFRLSAPWDVLYQINFDNLVLTANLTTKEVGISYKLGLNLGIVDIETIGLKYVNRAGRKTVDIAITGTFFDQKYSEENPLSWDMLNDPAPTPPGKGDQLLDLRYLGVGQNVAFRSVKDFTNVQDVIAAMESDFLPVPSSGKKPENPLQFLDKLRFSPDGNWLIGADFTLMGAISLSVVFNDPQLYGLRVALSGDKVKNFSGLDFQILYKKVTDTIGVYHIELTLPQAFRQFQLGAVSVTLPMVIIDVYTNGNFRIDLGFPVGLDFSRSFCVQAGVFIGYGGLYFALLDGATSERVPRITNGTFSPVIEAGLALSIGLGRTIDKGVLSAGLSVTVTAIVQGDFGWFNPNDKSSPSALFYRIQGTAAIVGKLYGVVNFVIIQAEVHVTAYASVTLTIESYKPILVELTIGVEISVSVKILFIRISFSFAAQLDLSFTIGSESPTPWILDTSQQNPLLLRQQGAFFGQWRLSGARLQRMLLASLGPGGSFDWTPRKVFPTTQTVHLSLVPSLTVALPAAVYATHALQGVNTQSPQRQIVTALYVENSVSTKARSAADVRRVERDDAATTPFNLLVEGMLQWALSSYTRQVNLGVPPPGEFALASDLEAIGDYLAKPDQWQSAFRYDSLAAMMELNYVLRVTTPFGPRGLEHPAGPQATVNDEVSSSVFPMIPDLLMRPEGMRETQFWNFGCIDRSYEDALGEYYAQLRMATGPTGSAGASVKSFRKQAGPVGCTAGEESLSTFVFRDYFSMVAKGAVNAASGLLKSYPYEPTGITGASGHTGPVESLDSIARQFSGVSFEYRTRPGDRLGTIAGRFGVAPSSIRVSNPHLTAYALQERLPAGLAVAIEANVTPAAIAEANSDYPLHYVPGYPVPMTIDGVRHQVQGATGGRAESLAQIARRLYVKDPVEIFTYLDQSTPPANPNVGNPELLMAGAPVRIPGHTFRVIAPEDDIPALVAAFYFVRSIGPAQKSQAPWYTYQRFYEQWIETNNASLTGATWTVPIVAVTNGALSVTGQQAYAPVRTASSPLTADTPELVGGYFAMMQLQPEPFTKGYQDFQRLVSPTGPTGTYAISPFTYTVQPGDTVASIAKLFGIPVADLAAANATNEQMLRTLAVVAMPTIDYPIAARDTLENVATRFDLKLEDLADSVQHNAGILAPYSASGPMFTVPDVPGRDTSKLVSDLVRFGRFNDVSGMVTRFLLHGMRAPKPGTEGPFSPATPLWGLYEMDGQQFPVPAGVTGPSAQLSITFKDGGSSSWICLGASGPSGSTGCERDLTAYLGREFFADPPASQLDPKILAGPGPLPLYRETPPRYPLQQSLHWQTAETVPIPGPTGQGQPATGQPSIWMFPPTLQTIAAAGGTGPSALPQYELMIANPRDPSGASDTPVQHYCWASAVDVRVQRAPSPSGGQPLANGCVLMGADQDGREALLAAWKFMQSVGRGSLYILYSPSAASNNSQGLVSDRVDPTATFLLKSNLTTVTKSNLGSMEAALQVSPAGDYYARLTGIPDFLRLAWEASVTGSGGFYLNYVNANGGGGLPATLFGEDAVATVKLLLIAGPQGDISAPDRGLYRFNNCALIGDNIDPATMSLYARLASPKAADLTRVATVAAGNAGFYMARVNPDPDASRPGPTGAADQTRLLYNLCGFQVAENDFFYQSNEGLPAGPGDKPAAGVSGPTGPGVWWYQQVLPVHRFGKENATPASVALPSAKQNPYAGIALGPRGATALSTVSIDLTFHDLYGNQTLETGPTGPVTAPMGYTDELIGISSWPSIGTDFLFSPGPSESVELGVQLSMQIDRYMPSGPQGFEQSSGAASADASRYGQIFYQVQQRDLGFALTTNLGSVALEGDALKAPVSGFVTKANVFTSGAASLKQRVRKTASGGQLLKIASEYNVTPTALAEENPNQSVQALFRGKVVQPDFTVAGPNNTLNLLAANQPDLPYPPVCEASDPACSNALQAAGSVRLRTTTDLAAVQPAPRDSQLTVAQLAANNRTAPLTPGIDLRTEPRVSSVPGNVAEQTMASVAAALQCVTYAVVADPAGGAGATVEIGLFIDNLKAANVVAPNIDIEIDGEKVDTGDTPTFESVQQAFAPLKLSTGDFVARLAVIPGIFAPNASVTHADFIVPRPVAEGAGEAEPRFTIDSLPAGTGGIEKIATWNCLVQNFYYTGSSIYLRYSCYEPTPFDTIASLSAQFGITMGQFAAFNGEAPLQGDVELKIPGLVYFDPLKRIYAPYSPTSADSLDSIAKKFASTPEVLAEINAELPGIFADNVKIIIGGTEHSPYPLDSLLSMARCFSLDLKAFVAAIGGTAGLFRGNGVIVTPLPVMPDAGGKQSPPADQVAELFHSTTSAIFAANQCLESFLQDGASVAGPTGPVPTKPIHVGPHDTIATILREFLDKQHATVTIEELAALNGKTSGLFTANHLFLLPPNPTRIETRVAPHIPPGATGCEQGVVFPVTVSASMNRSQHLVSPDFRESRPVFTNTSVLRPRGAQNGEALALTEFARSFESAFAAYRLKCAVASRNSVSDPGSMGELMAVNFGDTGVKQFEVQAGAPQFYALAPLSTSLQSGRLWVRSYQSGSGLCPATLKTFDSVDLDGWMQQFLAAVDLFLSAPYAVPAFQLNSQTSAQGPRGLQSLRDAAPVLGPMGTTGCTGGTGAYGPGNFDDIVASKLAIAGELKKDVVPILQGAGATGGYYQEVARESLYQQMQVRLSDAYAVNAIVQYPVAVKSPCLTPPPGFSGPVPPRTSGTVVPDLVAIPNTTGSGAGTLQALAPGFGVSTPFIAETIGDVQGLLLTCVPVCYEGKQHMTQAQDTLNTVATHFRVPTDPNLPGYWKAWMQFVDAIEKQPILRAGTPVPAVKMTRQVLQGNTLGAVAEYFGVDAGPLGEANQAKPGIFVAKQVIQITGYQPYTVQPDDTLLHIAQTMVPDPGSDPMTVAVLSQSVANQPGLMAANQSLFMTQPMQDVTTSTTKVSLGPVNMPGRPDPALSFLFSVRHPRQYRSLFLNLKYVINELEFDIDTVANSGGYQSSSWLTFLLPIGSGDGFDAGVKTAMDQVQIPIPLRAYPVPPTVQAQSGLPTPHEGKPASPAEAIEQGKQWDYRFDFEGQSAAQDTNHAEVVFNQSARVNRAMLSRTDYVFQALAEFIDAWPELSRDLALLPEMKPGQNNHTAAVAVQVLDTLAAGVARALSMSNVSLLQESMWPELKYQYRLQTTTNAGNLAELALGMEKGPSGMGPLWPDVFIRSLTGPTGQTGPDAGFEQLKRLPPHGMTADFLYPPGFGADQRITQRFLFRERDVIRNQNASGGIYVTRNDDLIASGPLGARAAGATGPVGNFATNPAFVYQTPLVRFIDPLTPIVVDHTSIDVSGLTGPSGPPSGPKSLAQHIVNVLDAVLELGPQSEFLASTNISMLCNYGFAAAGAGTPGEMVATTPIRLVTTQLITPSGKNAFAVQLANSIRNWPGWGSTSSDGVLILDFTAYTTPPGATGPLSPKPILEFSNLRIPVSSISGWTKK